jgi:hypothetical protein
LNGWPEKSFAVIDDTARAAVEVSGDRLYAAFRTGDPALLVNSGRSPQMLFKTGGALDIMVIGSQGPERLLIAQVNGKPIAVLYRLYAANAQPVPFASPQRTVRFDRVDDVTGSVTLAARGGDYVVSVPLSLLGLSIEAGSSVRGDIGVLRGNGFETLDRVYWSNKASGLTSDIPSEAELLPQLWGTWTPEQ